MARQNHDILHRVPGKPDTGKHYLFYLHGLIVEEAGIRPESTEHGFYEYELILEELGREGFTIISEVRAKGTQILPYAEKLAGDIRELQAKGVPPTNIIVVGASKGGVIAAYASSILREKELSFVFLSSLFEKCLKDENLTLYGNALSIHDSSDSQSITPEIFFLRSQGQGQFEQIVLNLGLGHGLLYRPYRQWIDPMVAWLRKRAC